MTMQPSTDYWTAERQAAQPRRHTPLLLYGALCFCIGLAAYLAGVLLVFPRYLLGLRAELDPAAEWLVWYSGVPIVLTSRADNVQTRLASCAVALLLARHGKAPPDDMRMRP